MDDTTPHDEAETADMLAHARSMQRAFGDDVAQRFLELRGVADEPAQQALVERYYQRQAQLRAHFPSPQS
jgi:hypothetical protein